ncbi:hypothetical protein HM1_0529 [Heliomicrobium modesticaldum Ice1]|uniref:Uncharacterized protein n=1 Tax=Heliobacterium modesticaldum (strain ATCC 51547 / Ice1) TaxID=498761 RepID=B0TFY6_HELMI|nr:hypothetical protein HM1_0529 [Heliomicrobium modesticaldum Ice1]
MKIDKDPSPDRLKRRPGTSQSTFLSRLDHRSTRPVDMCPICNIACWGGGCQGT